ncbi:MAG: HAD family hydrolase [bacterium]|nr:HAD family hydrolase [bacterium]
MPITTSTNSKSSLSLIIFDFDGVLVDSFDLFFKLNKEALARVGLKLTKIIYRDFFNGNVHASFRSFTKDDQQYKNFQKYRQAGLDEAYANPRLFPFAISLVKKLSKHYPLAIASSTPRELIMQVLKKHRLEKYFFFVSGSQGHSKEEALRAIIKKAGAQPQQTVMITDTVGDILVAQKVDLKTIAVTWGFHSKNTLSKSKPNKIIQNFKSLEKNLIPPN